MGTPIAIGLIVFGPYWSWNAAYGVTSWWRIPVLPPGIFDLYAYLQWLGQIANGLDIGGQFRWFEWPLRIVATRLYPSWSIPEIWFLTRWVTTILSLWIGAWCIRTWSGLGVWPSRLFSACLWFSLVLVLGMRPGVFSWYLPAFLFGMAAAMFAVRALGRGRIAFALLWSALALFATSLYPWFFLPVGIWIASAWSVWFIGKQRNAWIAVIVLAAFVFAATSIILAPILESSAWWPVLMDMQERMGIAQTWMPQIANPFVAMLCWVALFAAVGRRAIGDAARRIGWAEWAWIALLIAWLVTPFTGYYIHNDHFRTAIAVLSWISLAVIWSATPPSFSPSQGEDRRGVWKAIPIAVLVVALSFIANILRKGYGTGRDDLDVLHLSLWFSLSVGAWIVIRLKGSRPGRGWMAALFVGAALIGIVPFVSAIQRQYSGLPDVLARQPVITWIGQNIPSGMIGCADPASAEFYAAHTGRRIVPAETTLYMKEDSETVIRRLAAYAGAYDLGTSGGGDQLRQHIGMNQGIACAQFPLQSMMLRAIGLSDERVDDIIGCPQAMLDRRLATILSISRSGQVDENAFKQACPWIIVPDSQKRFWRIPSDYVETRVDGTTSIFSSVKM